jgi:hypothetical protein
MIINEREANLNQEKISIYKQKQELEVFKTTILCTKCKGPVNLGFYSMPGIIKLFLLYYSTHIYFIKQTKKLKASAIHWQIK